MADTYARPYRLLSSNSELAEERILNWSLPAWAGRLKDGRTYNTCPNAGVCRHACYALSGTYLFPNVRHRHEQNLAYVLDDLDRWHDHMCWELSRRKNRHSWVRIHDTGDFFSDNYTRAWLSVIRNTPEFGFYAYTKEVSRFRRLVEPDCPGNFLYVYSYGGREDHLINPDRDRVADVFPDLASLEQAGFHDQAESDVLAVVGPRLVGITSNNIPHLRRRQGDRSFREWQEEESRRLAEKAARHAKAAPPVGDDAAAPQ